MIADSAITAYTSCYAGSGADDAEVLVAVPELLRAAAATVADICVPGSAPRSSSSGGLWSSSPPASVPASVPAPAEEEQAGAQRQEAAATAAAALPLPWQAGQVEVTLEGVVAHRRKIARLLLFANLVPLAAVEQAAAAAMLSPKVGSRGQHAASFLAASFLALLCVPWVWASIVTPLLIPLPCFRSQGLQRLCAGCGGILRLSSPRRCSSLWERHWRIAWGGEEANGEAAAEPGDVRSYLRWTCPPLAFIPAMSHCPYSKWWLRETSCSSTALPDYLPPHSGPAVRLRKSCCGTSAQGGVCG